MTPLRIRAGSTSATVAAECGFNLHSLEVDGFDYLHAEQGFPTEGSPTRSGIPILFPWPNRIAGAAFEWEGTRYDLPVTEAATGSAIHGYAVAAAWDVVAVEPDRVTGRFTLTDDPAHPWPATGTLTVTYRVEPAALTVTCEVAATGDQALPYGLGFHPYLRVPGPAEQWLLQVGAAQEWPLAGMVPSGPARDVPPERDFRRARRIADLDLDDVFTGLPPAPGISVRAALWSMASRVTVACDPGFREIVVFTPGSRDAVAIEPYTCASDAVHLQGRGIDAGWRVLPAGRVEVMTWRIDIS